MRRTSIEDQHEKVAKPMVHELPEGLTSASTLSVGREWHRRRKVSGELSEKKESVSVGVEGEVFLWVSVRKVARCNGAMNAFSVYHLAKMITDTIFCSSLISVNFGKIQVLPVDY